MRAWLLLLPLVVLTASTCPGDYDALLAAVKAEDVPTVKRLLEAGTDPNPVVPPDPVVQAGKQRPLPMMPDNLVIPELGWPEKYYPKTALHYAAWAGELEIVRLLLNNGADPNRQDAWAQTPLIAALCRGDGPMAKLLLERGADPNLRCQPRDAPLALAIRKGLADVALMLLDRGATPGKPDLLTALLKLPALVLPLLQHGADWRQTGFHGSVPHLMAEGGLTGAVQFLLDHGVGADEAYPTGATLLHTAALRGRVEVARLLLDRGANVNAKTDSGATPLMYALERGNQQTVDLLLERGARHTINTAATVGDLAQVKELLAAGAPVDAPGYEERTPLMSAAEHGHVDVALYLMTKGANGQASDRFGVTALLFAALAGDLGLVEALTEAGADVNGGDKALRYGDWTPLQAAAGKGHLQVVEKLLGLGAEVDRAGEGGSTPLSGAAAAGHEDVARMLLEHGAAATYGALASAAAGGNVDLVKLLLAKGAPVAGGERPESWATPMHWAACYGNIAMAQALFEAGADVNAFTDASPLDYEHRRPVPLLERQTPLGWAVYLEQPAMVRWLAQHGAMVDYRISEQYPLHPGSTPLHLAAEIGNLEVVKGLLEAGAPVDAKDAQGKTPAEYAEARKQAEVAAYLRGRAGRQ
jgi:ankyrin repeat protein